MSIDRLAVVINLLAAAAKRAKLPLTAWVDLRRALIAELEGRAPAAGADEDAPDYPITDAAPDVPGTVSSDAVALAEAVLRLHPADVTTPRCEWSAVSELAARVLGRPTARARKAG